MRRTTGSSSSSTAAGVRRSTRNSYSRRRSRSTAQKRKPPDGWPPRRRLLTCRGTRSTSGPPMPRRGCPRTAPRTGCARSTATNPGTSNCAPKPSIRAARPCMPTPPRTRGCSSDQHGRPANRCQPNHHTRKETMSRKLGPLAALAVVALIGAGAGCSNASSNDGTSNNDAANATADNQDQGVKFAECMRENGVSDFPDPNASGELDDRWGGEWLVDRCRQRGMGVGNRARARTCSHRVYGRRADPRAAVGGPGVRPVRARQRRRRTFPTPSKVSPSSTRLESHPPIRPRV